MIELGRVQELMVVREKNFGVYLGQKKDDAAAVLLPKNRCRRAQKWAISSRYLFIKIPRTA